MSKSKRNKTLRTIKTDLKKQKRFHGGAAINEYKILCDSYVLNIEEKKENYNKLSAEATHLYDAETTFAHTAYQDKMNNVVYYLRDFLSGLQNKYTAPVIPLIITQELESIIAEAVELLDAVSKMNVRFQSTKVHLHLLEVYMQYVESLKISVNSINIRFEKKLSEYNAILLQREKDNQRKLRDDALVNDEIEYKYNDLESAIALVNRPPPDGFILNLDKPPIIGCPLGTVLVGDQCVYTNDLSGATNVIESVPYQANLQTTEDSPLIILFNNISQVGFGKPTIYKRKLEQYLLPLKESDATLYRAKYIVAESNGTPKKDVHNEYTFIKSVECCWDQNSASILPTGSSYYSDTDTFPQPVKILDTEAPTIHRDESFTQYVCALNEVDQIILGIPYIKTDLSGAPIYDINNKLIPFFPDLLSYKRVEEKFIKPSYNRVDTFTYVIVKQYDNSTSYTKNIFTLFDTAALDPYVYNTLPIVYKNKFIKLELHRPFLPFRLPNLLMSEGDYFLVYNTDTVYPIIFNISVNSLEQRILVYPNQICTFVYSKRSNMVHYGYLYFSKNQNLKETSSVALIPSLNVYAFVEAAPLYDNGTYIMQQYTPLLDSENAVVPVPNFSLAQSVYYERDDIFKRLPLNVQIVEPVQKIVNGISYKNIRDTNTNVSTQHRDYVSDYVCQTLVGGGFVFCDTSGVPHTDIFGYLIPVPTPIHYTNSTYVWVSQDVKKTVTVKRTATEAYQYDASFKIANQLTSSYTSLCDKTVVYTDSSGVPLVCSENQLIVAPVSGISSGITVILPLGFTLANIDVIAKDLELNKQYILLNTKYYYTDISLLEEKYKDLSGSMNNYTDLKNKLNIILQKMQLETESTLLDTLEIEASKIYADSLITYEKLEAHVYTQALIAEEDEKINNLKTLRKNELLEISKISTNLEKLLSLVKNRVAELPTKMDSSRIKSEYEMYLQLYNKINSSKSMIVQNVDSANDLVVLQNQEQNVLIVLKSFQSLEQNLINFQTTVAQELSNYNSSLLVEKRTELQSYINYLESIPDTIEIYKSQKNELLESYKEVPLTVPEQRTLLMYTGQIDVSFRNMLVIDSAVKNDKSTILQTADTINNTIENTKTYITTVNSEKVNIESYIKRINYLFTKSLERSVVASKNSLYLKINKYFESIKALRLLEDKLNLNSTEKESIEKSLGIYESEAQEIYAGVDTNNNVVSLKAQSARIDELDTMTKEISSILENYELTQPVVAAPVPEVAGEVAPETYGTSEVAPETYSTSEVASETYSTPEVAPETYTSQENYGVSQIAGETYISPETNTSEEVDNSPEVEVAPETYTSQENYGVSQIAGETYNSEPEIDVATETYNAQPEIDVAATTYKPAETSLGYTDVDSPIHYGGTKSKKKKWNTRRKNKKKSATRR